MENNEGEWTGKEELGQKIKNKNLAVFEACVAIFPPTPSFKGSFCHLWILNRGGTLNYASVVPPCVTLWDSAIRIDWIVYMEKRESGVSLHSIVPA